jgi:hypothetical protein
MGFESWRDWFRWIIEQDGGYFLNDRLAIRVFHGQGKIGARSHYVSAALQMPQ